ncbi:MAG: Glycosyl transferase family 2 [uncultured bacterium]|nr:MAG: Glycosyl transferase family 2 [uncultured bacterium]
MMIAIVPCYNAGHRVKKVLSQVKKHVDRVVFVDDGSTDKSCDYARSVEGVEIISHKKNLGKGYALVTGFRYALKNNDVDFILVIDSDGQHNPNDIPKLISAQKKMGADIVIGGRLGDRSKMPPIRKFSNLLSSLLISLSARQRIRDTQSGFRLIKRVVLEKIELKPGRYETEASLLIEASRAGFKIFTTKVDTIYRDDDGKIASQFKGFRDTLRISWVILRNIF